MNALPLKAEQLGSAKWDILAIPFGGPLKGGRDTDHEYFSPRSDIKAEWFNERPVIFHHGQDPMMTDERIGIEDNLRKGDGGWWATLWLERSARYFDKLNGLIAAGKMFGSSGTMNYLVKKALDGEILRWPHVEQTLTPTPANVLSILRASKAVADFRDAGLDPSTLIDQLEALGADLSVTWETGDRTAKTDALLSSLFDELEETIHLAVQRAPTARLPIR